uniref:Plastocyanin-like domain-containing protein n=3 Tax=Caenorhabditis japonica TaxID=281687 RepID=A0A8R1DM13_CAEJA
MAYKNDNKAKHATPVDYDYKTQSWTKRDPDQLKPCFKNESFNFISDPGDQNRMEDVLVVDGLHKRVITINGDMPGEPIVVPYMSEVWIRVSNQVLMDSMTIHVHGIDKHGMWYMDGVAFVQQCPIQSTNRFEYRFIADNKGTHWYHGHMQTDRGDGIAGGGCERAAVSLRRVTTVSLMKLFTRCRDMQQKKNTHTLAEKRDFSKNSIDSEETQKNII